MSDATNQSTLEAARARLEAALSGLAQRAASSRDALDLAAEVARDKIALESRVSSLEQENLKLHEQVAAYALQPDPSENEGRIAELEQEKIAIEQNYQMLKEKYVALQDHLEERDAPPAVAEGANDNSIEVENGRLKQVIAEMEAERNAIKMELDKTISELENMLEDA